MAQLTALYNADPGISVSEHTVEQTLLDMGLHSKRLIRVTLLKKKVIVIYTYSGPGNIEIGSWINARECLGQMNHDFSFIVSLIVLWYTVIKANSCSLSPS